MFSFKVLPVVLTMTLIVLTIVESKTGNSNCCAKLFQNNLMSCVLGDSESDEMCVVVKKNGTKFHVTM